MTCLSFRDALCLPHVLCLSILTSRVFSTAILLFMLFPKLRTSLLTWSAWPMMRGAHAESPPWIPKRLWFTNTKLYRFPSVSCSWAYTLFAGKGPILIIFISTRTLKCSKMLVALNWTPGKPEWRQGVLEFGMALYSTDAPLWEGLWWPLKAFFFFLRQIQWDNFKKQLSDHWPVLLVLAFDFWSLKIFFWH